MFWNKCGGMVTLEGVSPVSRVIIDPQEGNLLHLSINDTHILSWMPMIQPWRDCTTHEFLKPPLSMTPLEGNLHSFEWLVSLSLPLPFK